MNDDHSKITGGLFHSRSQEKRLTAQVPEISALKDRLSRYETALREALDTMTPLSNIPSILCAALSDQPAAEPAESKLEAKCERRVLEARIDEHAKTCGDCNETNPCDDMLELRRWLATLSDQPAESKLEAPNELLKLVAQAFFIIGSLELSSSGNREANEAASAWRKKASAILDAQPITPEPKGE